MTWFDMTIYIMNDYRLMLVLSPKRKWDKNAHETNYRNVDLDPSKGNNNNSHLRRSLWNRDTSPNIWPEGGTLPRMSPPYLISNSSNIQTNRKSYTSFRLVPLLMTLKYIWKSFSLGCHFHVHFSYPWHAFASHGLPAIAELLVEIGLLTHTARK